MRLKTDLRRRHRPHRRARAGCGRARGVLGRPRRPHRPLRRPGARRRPRRGGERGAPLCRVLPRDGEAVGLRLRPRRQGTGSAEVRTILASRRSRRRTMRPMPSRSPSATRSRPPLLRRPADRYRADDRALPRRPVARTVEGLVLEVGGVGYLVARDPVRDPTDRGQGRGRGRDPPPRPGGRPSALRLRRPERARSSSSCSASPASGRRSRSGSSRLAPGRAQAGDRDGDAALFQTIPGIGGKPAERIVLELKEKMARSSPRRPRLRRRPFVARDASSSSAPRSSTPSAAGGVDPDLPPRTRPAGAGRPHDDALSLRRPRDEDEELDSASARVGSTSSSARSASRSSSPSRSSGEGQRRGARPRPPRRAPGLGKTSLRASSARRSASASARRRPGARAEGRRRDPRRGRGARRPLRRRGPPPQPRYRGDPLPGARGLPADIVMGQGTAARTLRSTCRRSRSSARRRARGSSRRRCATASG